MEPQYSAFWISKVLLPASHAVMFGLDGLTPSQIKLFVRDVYQRAQGNVGGDSSTAINICGFSTQAATDILLDLGQSNQNFQRFVSGSPLLFFLFLLLMSQYEKAPESHAIGSRDSSVVRSRKFIDCLKASLFSLPSSENLRASNVKGSFYTLMTSLSQRNILLALDGLELYPNKLLDTVRSKQVIKSFFDEPQLPNANVYFPAKAIESRPTVIPTPQPIPTNTTPNTTPNTTSNNSDTNVIVPNIQITRPTVNVSIPSVVIPSDPIVPPTRIDIDKIEQTEISQQSMPTTQVPSTQVPSTQVPNTQPSNPKDSIKQSSQTKSVSNQTILIGSGVATIGIFVLGYWLYKKSQK